MGPTASGEACPGAQTIYVSNVPKTAGLYSLTLKTDLSKWVVGKYDTMHKINQMSAFMWASTMDYMEASPESKLHQCHECNDFQMSVLRTLNTTLLTEDMLGVYSPMVLGVVYPIFMNPSALQNDTLSDYANFMWDYALTIK